MVIDFSKMEEKVIPNFLGGEGALRAKLRVEDYCERRLYDKDARQGAEFNLRFNFHWQEPEGESREEAGGVVLMPQVQEKTE